MPYFSPLWCNFVSNKTSTTNTVLLMTVVILTTSLFLNFTKISYVNVSKRSLMQ